MLSSSAAFKRRRAANVAGPLFVDVRSRHHLLENVLSSCLLSSSQPFPLAFLSDPRPTQFPAGILHQCERAILQLVRSCD